jgi:hypothetical protein
MANKIISVVLRREKLLWHPLSFFEDGSPAIRIPRDRPSKSWWKMIAVTSEARQIWISL